MTSDLLHGDCLALLAGMPSESVDAVVTDPPYFRAKPDGWDRQWNTAGDYLKWLGLCLAEFARVLKPNGSLYLFASPQMAARVQMKVGEHFHVLNEIISALILSAWNSRRSICALHGRASTLRKKRSRRRPSGEL